jgi:hypothetical protein
MSIQAKNGRGAAGSMALALLTVLALLVAPVCAPLCAAKVCGSGAAPGQCHEAVSVGSTDNDSPPTMASGKTCRIPELSAVISKADKMLSASREFSGVTSVAKTHDMPTRSFAGSTGSLGDWRDARTRFESAASLLSTSVLRI